MPIFEQKLICPLAIRFTQEHIRTTFRDGRLLDPAYEQIKFKRTSGDYDILLEAPFPNIEIIRWHPPRHGKDRREDDHWFTLDNRRLYCLQRAAVDHWPLRVAATVDLLYADPGTVWRKFDSTTHGQSTTIGHSARGPQLCRWDWYVHAARSKPGSDVALQAIALDDSRGNRAALLDAPEDESSLSLVAQALAGAFPAGKSETASKSEKVSAVEPTGCATPSTVDSLEEQDHAQQAGCPEDSEADQGTPPEASEVPLPLGLGQGMKWLAARGDASSSGDDAKDDDSSGGDAKDEEEALSRAEEQAKKERARLVEEALAEVEKQLRNPQSNGYVWVLDWNQRYYHHLGMLRSFIEDHPDRFVVCPGRGRGYSVTLASASGEERSRKAPMADIAPGPVGAPPRRWQRGGAIGAASKKWVVTHGVA